MGKIDQIVDYLNPLRHLGERRYPTIFTVTTLFAVTVLLEIYVTYVLHDPTAVGSYAIVIYIILIIYFSFRTGINGGLMAVLMTISYYLYILYSRRYAGSQLVSGLNTTGILAITYLILSTTIGWLKERIDILIETEVNDKKRLLTIIKQLPVGVIVTDIHGNLLEVNTEMMKIAGRKLHPGSIVGTNSFRLLYPGNGKIVQTSQYPLYRSIRTGNSVSGREMTLIRPDGKQVEVLISSAPIMDKFNQITAGVSIYQDVTSLRELEQRKDDFVNMASHELKTPLTSLILYLSILKKKLAENDMGTVSTSINRIEKQTDNLLHIISNLLDVSRYQIGKMKYDLEEFRLDELVKEATDTSKGASSDHRLVYAKMQPLTVRADKHRINQVITNLLTNAYKYSNHKSAVVIGVAKRGPYAQVSISDRGMGIPKSQQKRIFEKLYQVPSKNTGTYPGFGMGLYISREIIKGHKGKIWVESQEGEGSTFNFTLPLTQ